jgi:hypothetical protein
MTTADTVTGTLRDAAYITIGFGVLGFQRAQVRRHELTKQFKEQLSGFEAQIAEGRKTMHESHRTVAELAEQLNSYVAPVRSQVEEQLDALEASLPVPVQDLVKQARLVAHQTEETLRTRFGLAA